MYFSLEGISEIATDQVMEEKGGQICDIDNWEKMWAQLWIYPADRILVALSKVNSFNILSRHSLARHVSRVTVKSHQ